MLILKCPNCGFKFSERYPWSTGKVMCRDCCEIIDVRHMAPTKPDDLSTTRLEISAEGKSQTSKYCKDCDYTRPKQIAPNCQYDFVSPVDGSSARMSAKCAREKECYCGGAGKCFVKRKENDV